MLKTCHIRYFSEGDSQILLLLRIMLDQVLSEIRVVPGKIDPSKLVMVEDLVKNIIHLVGLELLNDNILPIKFSERR